jgi:hypothetical protein
MYYVILAFNLLFNDVDILIFHVFESNFDFYHAKINYYFSFLQSKYDLRKKI